MSTSRFLAIALKPSESVILSNCALMHAALADENGPCRVFIDNRLLCVLTDSEQQQRISLPLGGSPASIRCEGPVGAAGVHLIGREASDNKRQRVSAADHNGVRAAPQQEEAASSSTTPPAAAASSSSSKRTPRLTFNPEVLVANYIKGRSGISPERQYASLDEMEAAAEQRALEEYEDEEDDDGMQPGSPAMQAFHELLKSWAAQQQQGGGGGAGGGGAGGGGGPSSTHATLMDLILKRRSILNLRVVVVVGVRTIGRS